MPMRNIHYKLIYSNTNTKLCKITCRIGERTRVVSALRSGYSANPSITLYPCVLHILSKVCNILGPLGNKIAVGPSHLSTFA